jgi:TolA-binding protein
LHRATVEAKGPAHYTWSPLPDEVVRVAEGQLSIQVEPLGRGERFRVVTGDAEVEVRGTAFDVSVTDDQLTSVKVAHGLVVVRSAQGPTVYLGRGEEWHAPPEAPLASRPSSAARAHAGPAERAFAHGWRALRSGGYAEAAGAFERAAEAGPGAALAEDARYWRAVALARGGHSAEARVAMSVFLELHPESTRAGEISAMLGWLLLDVHDHKGATRHFTDATTDPVPAVRSSARAGLSAVSRSARAAAH